MYLCTPSRNVAGLCLGLALLVSTPCLAQERSHGVALFEAASFEAAGQYFTSIMSSPTASPAELAEAALYSAALRLADGQDAEATRLVQMAAAIDPGFAPPAGLSPQIVAIHAEVIAEQPPGGLGFSVAATPCEGQSAEATIQAEVTGAGRDLVTTIIVRCGEHQRTVDRSADAPVELSIPIAPESEGLSCIVEAAADTGAVYRRQSVELAPCAPLVTEPPPPVAEPADNIPVIADPPQEEDEASVRRRRRVWIGLGCGTAAVVAAVAVIVVLTTSPDQAEIGPVRLDGF